MHLGLPDPTAGIHTALLRRNGGCTSVCGKTPLNTGETGMAAKMTDRRADCVHRHDHLVGHLEVDIDCSGGDNWRIQRRRM